MNCGPRKDSTSISELFVELSSELVLDEEECSGDGVEPRDDSLDVDDSSFGVSALDSIVDNGTSSRLNESLDCMFPHVLGLSRGGVELCKAKYGLSWTCMQLLKMPDIDPELLCLPLMS